MVMAVLGADGLAKDAAVSLISTKEICPPADMLPSRGLSASSMAGALRTAAVLKGKHSELASTARRSMHCAVGVMLAAAVSARAYLAL